MIIRQLFCSHEWRYTFFINNEIDYRIKYCRKCLKLVNRIDIMKNGNWTQLLRDWWKNE